MSGANAPKLSGPVSITVKKIRVSNLRASEKEFCCQYRNFTLFVPRNGNQTALDRVSPLPNLIFQRDRWFL